MKFTQKISCAAALFVMTSCGSDTKEQRPTEQKPIEQRPTEQKPTSSETQLLYEPVCDQATNCNTSTPKTASLLAPAQEKQAADILAHNIQNILSRKSGNGIGKVYEASRIVFELTAFPNLIFKKAEEKELEANLKRLAFSQCTLEKCNLDQLVIPKTQSLEVKAGNTTYYFLIEEKLKLRVPGGKLGAQENDFELHYMKMNHDPNLTEQLKRMFKQLAVFIIETGFEDVKYDNIPIIESPDKNIKIGLIDIESVFANRDPSAFGVLFKGANYNPVLPHDFYDDIISLAQKHTKKKEFWANNDKKISAWKLRKKELSDYFVYLNNKGLSWGKFENAPIKKGSLLLQCKIEKFAPTDLKEKEIVNNLNGILDWAINWSDGAPYIRGRASLMSLRYVYIDENFPAFYEPAIPGKARDFYNNNTDFLTKKLNITGKMDSNPNEGWGQQYCSAVQEVLEKAVAHKDIFSYECKMDSGNFYFRIRC